MNKSLRLLIIILIYFNLSINFCFSQSITKTVENVQNKIRRELYLNDNLDVIREDYYSNQNQKIIVSIEYNNPNIINSITGFINYPTIAYKIDFANGTYFDSEDSIELKFKDNFYFVGEQKGKNIIVNYINNKKEGKLVQADSVAIGKKTVVYNKVDTRYLKYDIIKFSQALGEESIYKMYKGVVLNFKNNKLNGKQKSYYGDASLKFDGYFFDNKLISYNSMSKTGSTISKLSTINGVSLSPQLLNGVILNRDFNYVFWHPDLTQTGDIFFDSTLYLGRGSELPRDEAFLYDIEKYERKDLRVFMGLKYYQRVSPYTLEFKKKFDTEKNTFSNPYVIKHLLNIPDFKIKKYTFSEEEDKSILAIRVDNKNIDTINTFKKSRLDLIDNFYVNISKQNFYLYRFDNQREALLIPHNSAFDKYVSLDELNMFSKLNSSLAGWMLNNFDIENMFYLSPQVSSDGDNPYQNPRKYIFDSASINSFLYVFVEKMLSNINEIKKGYPSSVNYSLLKNPFDGVIAGYNSDKNDDSHFRFFNFRTLGDSIFIKNIDGVRFFKIFDKYRTDYYDGKCLYSFLFDEGSYGKFKVEKIDIVCQ
jgi:hypothetical protein